MTWLADFIELIFPRTCAACNIPLEYNEKLLCTSCFAELPYTNYHLWTENPVEKIFWGRVKIEFATSLLHFTKKGHTQHLLHQLKYNGRKDVGVFLGELLAHQIKELFIVRQITHIVPIPLHPKRLKQRGYNQAECIARGISNVLNIPVCVDLVVRSKETATQTRKNRIERWDNVSQVFDLVGKVENEYPHFLIVDDVLTTGATIESCAHALLKCKNAKISVVTIAKA